MSRVMPRSVITLRLLSLCFALLSAAARATQTAPRSVKSQARTCFTVAANAAKVLALLAPLGAGANAASRPGTLEQDAGFYLRNALGLKAANKVDDVRSAIFKSPRTIDKNIADQVVAIMIKAAAEAGIPVIQQSEIMQEVSAKLAYFKQSAPIKAENTSDQYYVDIIFYAIYQVVARRIPSSQQRVAFRERVGDGILDSILARQPSLPLSNNGGPAEGEMQKVARGVEVILRDFETSGLIKGFSFDAEDFGDERFAMESFSANQAVSTEIQLTEPCNVLSFIEGIKENTLFHPEFVGTTLVQYLRRCSYDGRFEDYLLNELYTESNVDVRAQDVVLELRMGKQGTFP